MTLTEKVQPFIILLAVFAGLGLGYAPAVAGRAADFILPLLMLTGAFLATPLRNFADLFRSRNAALAIALAAFPGGRAACRPGFNCGAVD